MAVEALFTLLWTRLLLLRGHPPGYLHLIGSPASERLELTPVELSEVLWCIHRTAKLAPRWFYSLPQALALQRMLLRRGSQGSIRFGVQHREGRTFVHCWLVLDHRILLGAVPGIERYTPFPGWPRGGIPGETSPARQ